LSQLVVFDNPLRLSGVTGSAVNRTVCGCCLETNIKRVG